MNSGFQFGGVFVAGGEDDVRGQLSVGERNPGVRRNGDGRGNARNDLEVDTGVARCHGLLGPTTEDGRVTAFQPHHRFPLLGFRDDQCVDG